MPNCSGAVPTGRGSGRRPMWPQSSMFILFIKCSSYSLHGCTAQNMSLLISLSIISHPAPSVLLCFWAKHYGQTYALDDQVHCFLILQNVPEPSINSQLSHNCWVPQSQQSFSAFIKSEPPDPSQAVITNKSSPV